MNASYGVKLLLAALAGALALAGASPAPLRAGEGEPRCTVVGDKVAVPQNLLLGQVARVSLSIRFDCPGQSPADVDFVLVMDRSDSMRGEPLEASIRAARGFVAHLDPAHHHAALVSFATEVSIDAEPTNDLSRLHRAIGWLVAEGRTNIAGGLRGAEEVLRLRARPASTRYVLLLTDGVDTIGLDPVPVAEQLRATGAMVYVIGLGGVDDATMQAIAGDPARVFIASSPTDLTLIYADILAAVTGSRAGQLRIEDEMGADVQLRAGSVQPAADETGPARLVWRQTELPGATLSLSYLVEPQRPGLLPTNRQAAAHYLDVDGSPRVYVFPVPQIQVEIPTPAPSPAVVYLPMLPVERCQEKTQLLDVALVLDTSGSMEGDKLGAARDAARAFVRQLRLPLDRAALIAFGVNTEVRVPLTGDRRLLERGIGGLGAAGGTPMSAGLSLARAELFASARASDRMPMVVLLSDGLPDDEGAALAAAEALRQSDATVFAIGLGNDVNASIMQRLASPGRYYFGNCSAGQPSAGMIGAPSKTAVSASRKSSSCFRSVEM